MSALLIIFLVIAFFFLFKFTAAFTAIVAIIAGTTTITTLLCVWQGTSYSLKASGINQTEANRLTIRWMPV